MAIPAVRMWLQPPGGRILCVCTWLQPPGGRILCACTWFPPAALQNLCVFTGLRAPGGRILCVFTWLQPPRGRAPPPPPERRSSRSGGTYAYLRGFSLSGDGFAAHVRWVPLSGGATYAYLRGSRPRWSGIPAYLRGFRALPGPSLPGVARCGKIRAFCVNPLAEGCVSPWVATLVAGVKVS